MRHSIIYILLVSSIICKLGATRFIRSETSNLYGRSDSNLYSNLKYVTLKIYDYLVHKTAAKVFSPYGFAVALNIILRGASGETADEIRKLFLYDREFSEENNAIADIKFQKIREKNFVKSHAFYMVDSIWIQTGIAIFPRFYTFTTSLPYTRLLETDLRDKNAPNRIDNWFDSQTGTKFFSNDVEFPDEGTFSMASMIYSNITFRPWEAFARFEIRQHYFDSQFFKEKQQFPFLGVRGSFSYLAGQFHDIKFQAVSIPYSIRIELILIVFNTKDAISQLDKTPDSIHFMRPNDRKVEDVFVAFPEFNATSIIRFDEIAKALGVKNAFKRGTADFSRMTKDQELFAGNIFQKTIFKISIPISESKEMLNVEEFGNATTKVVIAEHPFLFILRDVESDFDIFMGKVDTPKTVYIGHNK